MSRAALTTEAVLLRSVPFGEADLIVTLYTRERGKVSALARSARKSRRRFGASLQLFMVGNAQLTERGRSELWTLVSLEIARDLTAIATDMAALAHGSYGLELVRELTAAEQSDPAVFELVVELLIELARAGASPGMLRAFELRLLIALGLGPVLERCVGCGDDEFAGTAGVLDGVRGGVFCGACAAVAGAAVKALPEAARILLVRAQQVERLADARELSGDGAGAARDAMLALVLAHVGKPLKSIEFIAKMTGASRRYS